jgi:arylsulfatase A-like enzyme
VSNFVLRKGTALERGFDLYDDRFPQTEAVRGLPERTATSTTDDALEMLDRLIAMEGERLFLWVHYQDPHGPYTPPEGYRERYLEAERRRADGSRVLGFGRGHSGLGRIPAYQRLGDRSDPAFYRAGYNAEVHYTDEQIGRLLDGVETRGLLADAVIVFLADHGESLGEDGYWFSHGEYLTDPLVRVPAFVRVPGRTARRREDVAALVDLVPTLLRIFGVPTPSGLPGRDLLAADALEQSTPAYLATLRASKVPRMGLVSDGFKYVATFHTGQVSEHLFRLGDYGEDLAGEDPQRLGRMRAQVNAIRANWASRKSEQRQELTARDREWLHALGYVSDP